jgi:hypothetical protein
LRRVRRGGRPVLLGATQEEDLSRTPTPRLPNGESVDEALMRYAGALERSRGAFTNRSFSRTPVSRHRTIPVIEELSGAPWITGIRRRLLTNPA